MSYGNVARRLDVAFREGYTIQTRTKTWTVTGDYEVKEAGAYFVDASLGEVTITLSSDLVVPGDLVNVKKIDQTANRVFIVPPPGRTIDNEDVIDLWLPMENLTIMSHDSNWFIM